MIRSPYWHGPGRGMDAEAGGVADLQTDVMRFMAILAICLVVIFALVQSIPLTAVQQPVIEPPPVAEPAPQPEPVAAVAVPAPVPDERPEPTPDQLTRSAPVVPTPAPVRAPAPPPPAPSQEGFTLQFESDIALTRLVARNEVGLYAIATDRSLRMNVNRGRFSFWPASAPNEFHEMDPSTVPADVIDALHRYQGHDGSVKWGVTLPANMQRNLDELVQSANGGALFIAGDGRLRLEQ